MFLELTAQRLPSSSHSFCASGTPDRRYGPILDQSIYRTDYIRAGDQGT
jgi:hypothetical protein